MRKEEVGCGCCAIIIRRRKKCFYTTYIYSYYEIINEGVDHASKQSMTVKVNIL